MGHWRTLGLGLGCCRIISSRILAMAARLGCRDTPVRCMLLDWPTPGVVMLLREASEEARLLWGSGLGLMAWLLLTITEKGLALVLMGDEVHLAETSCWDCCCCCCCCCCCSCCCCCCCSGLRRGGGGGRVVVEDVSLLSSFV